MSARVQSVLFCLVFLLTTDHSFGQESTSCTHISDWNELTYETIQNLHNTNRSQLIDMPVVIHQWSNYNQGQVMGMISHLNNYFANNDLLIEFTLCAFIDYDTSIDASGSDIQDLAEIYNVPNTINIYVANEMGSSGASTVTSDVNESWIGVSRFEPSTIVHEMGHYFGLLHTHNRSWGDELVDGSNCSTAGDRFCDTPADPNLNGEVNNSCKYIGNETDANGNQYHPDTSNLMSYAHHFCRTNFSEEQKTFMLNTIDVKYSEYACGATSVETPEIQNTFRVFPNPSSGLFFIEAPEKTDLKNINLAVYDLSGKMVHSSSNLSKHPFDLSMLAAGMYFIRIYSADHTSIQQLVLDY